MTLRVIGILVLMMSIGGLIYTTKLTELFSKWGILKLGLTRETSQQEETVRFLILSLGLIGLIIFSQNTRLIIGLVGMMIGGVIMFYSVTIHRFLAAGGAGGAFFRGDNGIKLFGLMILLFSALWMSGITQNILIWFFGSAGLIPSSDL